MQFVVIHTGANPSIGSELDTEEGAQCIKLKYLLSFHFDQRSKSLMRPKIFDHQDRAIEVRDQED